MSVVVKTRLPFWEVPDLTMVLVSYCDFSTRLALAKCSADAEKSVDKMWTLTAKSALASLNCESPMPLSSALFFAKRGNEWVAVFNLDETSQWTFVQFDSDASLEKVLETIADHCDDSAISTSAHIWFRFGQLKHIYAISRRCTMRIKTMEVTEKELESEDSDRYVELPGDCLYATLDSVPGIDMHVAVIERKNADGQWPMAKSKDTWRQFQVGDIIDAKYRRHNEWFLGVIRKVGAKGSELQGALAVHFIGFTTRWDDYVTADDENTARRGTHTTAPRSF